MSLRLKIALGVALPALFLVVLLSVVDNRQDRQHWINRMERDTIRTGEVLLTAMHEAMHRHDPQVLSGILADVVDSGAAGRVQLIDVRNQVRADSRKEAIGTTYRLDAPGCVECHSQPAGSLPQAVELAAGGEVLRVAVPVANGPECTTCHATDGPWLGVMLADISMAPLKSHLDAELRDELAVWVGGALLVILIMSLLVHWLVVRRVEAIHRPLASYTAGDFSARLPAFSGPPDELSELSASFNRMADELEGHVREREERVALRQQAITEERERIGRELHDGMAQILGYVNTKAMATRLLVKNRQWEAADVNLRHLEAAARDLLVDVRSVILGLRLTRLSEAGLPAMLGDFTAQYSLLTGLPVELDIASGVNDVTLPADVELQLLRIVQEALANVRKHAEATHAEVSLRASNGFLDLTITDDGQGFDPNNLTQDERAHFGLSTLRERAEAIGALLTVDSCPGSGTCVFVRLPLTKG
jgi:signal transduction histidine kinase